MLQPKFAYTTNTEYPQGFATYTQTRRKIPPQTQYQKKKEVCSTTTEYRESILHLF